MEINKKKIKVNFHSSICLCGDIYIDPLNITKPKNNARIVFITHSHWDHLDEQSLKNVATKDTVFVCPKDCCYNLKSLGFAEEKIVAVEPKMKFKILDVTCETFPAYNIGKEFHPLSNGWVGYTLLIGGICYTICGDTDLTEELKSIKTDVLFVPIGGTYTMDAEDAAKLTNKIKPKLVVPMHYGKIVGGKVVEQEFVKKLNKNIECLIVIKR